MMTEDEARLRWCPFARATVYVRGDLGEGKDPVNLAGHGCNRILTDDAKITANLQDVIDDLGATKCIASQCMAWRSGIFPHQRELMKADRTPNVGYCGLAGEPR